MSKTEVFNFIHNFYPDTTMDSKTILLDSNLDIYVPSINLAVEFCTFDTTSPTFSSDKNYHFDKMQRCEAIGIRVITIFQDEWTDMGNQVRNFLLSVLNKNTRNIYARKCKIKELTRKEAAPFLEEHHIQGKVMAKILFGIFLEDELLGVISGSQHHRQHHETTFVLNRLAFKSDVNVVGGSSKLVKVLLKYAKDNGYKNFITWSDSRYSVGNVYQKLGFKYVETLPPDYSYITPDNGRVSKQSCQKKHLVKRGAPAELTEHEMSKFLGYVRIFDNGKVRWEMSFDEESSENL